MKIHTPNPKTTNLQQQLSMQINMAFTMHLSANALMEFVENHDLCNLDVFDQIIVQLKWLSRQNKEIISSITGDDGADQLHITPVFQISERIQSLIQTIKLIVTKQAMERDRNIMVLDGKLYYLVDSIYSLYEALREI